MGVLAPCRETPVIQACPAGPAGDRDARFLPCWVQARFCRFGVGRWVVETLSRCVRRGGCPMNGFPGSRDGWCFGNQRARHRLGYAARRGLGHGSMVCLDRLAADCGGQSGGELAGREAILGQVGDGYRPGGEEAEGAGLRLRGRTRPPRQPYRRPPVSLGSRLGAAGWRGCRAGRLAAVCHDVRQRRLPRAYDGLSCRRTG